MCIILTMHPVPSFGRMLGPITPASTEQHICYAARVFGQFHIASATDEYQLPECMEQCPRPWSAVMLPSILPPASTSSLSTPKSSDDSSISTSLLHALLPELNHDSPPPSPRSFLFLPDSPPLSPLVESNHLREVAPNLDAELPRALPTYTSVSSWQSCVTRDVATSPEEFFLKAPDVGSAAKALVEFIAASHLGQGLTLARRAELGVKIPAHSSVAGLFITDTITFHVYAHFLPSCQGL
jgi:hypothetical protein